MRRVCSGAVWIYAGLCVLALAYVPVVGASLFEPNAFAAIFAVAFGLPWSLLTPHLFGDAGVAAGLAAIGVGMAVNVAILLWLCRRLR